MHKVYYLGNNWLYRLQLNMPSNIGKYKLGKTLERVRTQR